MEDKKAKTHKGKLYLESLLPKLKEDPKQCIFINTANSSEIMRMILNDLYILRKDYSKKLNKKEIIENLINGRNSIEFLCEKNNCSLFTFSSDTKKRPMDITFGLTYNHSILDSFNFEVTNYIPIEYFHNNISIDSYMKPILFFQGELFESDYNYDRVKKFFIDYFKLYDVESAIISELKRIIVISIDNDDKIIKIRNFQVEGEIKEDNLNNINFIEIGPSLDLKERKFIIADDELYKKTLKQPKAIMDVKKKNIEKNELLGTRHGIIHMQKQNLNAVSLRKYKKIIGKKRFGKKGEKFEEEFSKQEKKNKTKNKSNQNIDLEE